ncbi:MAG: transcription elongation factor GreA [Patescibacteria group bacterium]|nr:transcription elongation factor GreA [Patescibacteria group bacterium]
MAKHLTPEGLEKLKKELADLKTVARKEVQERIRSSAAHGDLKENAGYHAAKDDQSFIEGRIIQLEDIINQAQVIEKKQGGGVQIGSVVWLKSKDGDDTYQIVEPEEADITAGKISLKSSLGASLLGKKKGDVVKFPTPNGVRECEIIKID